MALSRQFLEQQRRQQQENQEGDQQSTGDQEEGEEVDSSESIGFEYQINHSNDDRRVQGIQYQRAVSIDEPVRLVQQPFNQQQSFHQQSFLRSTQEAIPITPQYLSHTFTPETTKKLVPATHPKLPSAIMIPEGYELESVEPLVPKQEQQEDSSQVQLESDDLEVVGSDQVGDQDEPTMPVAVLDRLQIPYESVQTLPVDENSVRQGPLVPVITISGLPRAAIFERPRYLPLPPSRPTTFLPSLPMTTKEVIKKQTSMTEKQKGYVSKVLDNYFKFITDIQKKKKAKMVREQEGSSEAINNRQLSKRIGGFWRKRVPTSFPTFIDLLVKKKK